MGKLFASRTRNVAQTDARGERVPRLTAGTCPHYAVYAAAPPSAAWTAAQAHGANLGNLSKWLSEEPARLAGLPRKGAIEAGRDADLVVWSPDTPADCATVYHRQPGSPYEEAALHGRVRHTLLRGRSVFSDGQHPDNACGEVLLGSTQ